MKVAIITDQHFGVKKGSKIYHDYFQRFYDEVFFPTLEKKGVTHIIDLGDTFDNRKSMDFNTFHRVKANYFDRLQGYKVHMLLGNHCTYYKNTNRINSPELLLEQYSNISIYSSPKHLTIGSKKFLMLPWINSENRDEVLNLLETSDADICCGHLELNGFEVTPVHVYGTWNGLQTLPSFPSCVVGTFPSQVKERKRPISWQPLSDVLE